MEKSLFFRRKNADFSARVARFFRKFWRSSGAKGRNLSLGLKASEKSEGTLPVQCDHSEAIARGSASRRRRQEPEIDHFTIKSRDCPIGQERSPPRSKRLAEKRIFAQLKFRSISITEREKTWQRPPGCSGSKLVPRGAWPADLTLLAPSSRLRSTHLIITLTTAYIRAPG